VPEIEIAIESLAAGGDGVGRDAGGRVVFVPFTAPGDRVRVAIVEERARFARGTLEEVLEPSPLRVQPPCGVYGACGGCTWQHLDYAAQLEAKRQILAGALERIAKLGPGELEITPSPSPYRYRGRTRVLAKDGRVGYRRRRSHDLCPTSRCPVLVPELDAELARLAASEPRAAEEWELVAGVHGTTRATPLRRPLPSEPKIELEVCGDRLAFSPGVFVQGNALLLDTLARAVHEAAGSGACAVELFAGAGFFTLGLARRFGRLVAVESEGRAVADLRANLARAGLDNVEVHGGRAEWVLARIEGAEVAVLDPPRTGLPAELLEMIQAPRVVYVSCDPATLARDLAGLAARGWALEALRGFDLFPQTPHLEAVATMAR